MIATFVLAAAYLSGVDPRRLALLATAVFFPLALVPFLVIVVSHGSRRVDHRATLFCDAVASELRAGSTLAGALEEAGSSVGLALPRDAGPSVEPDRLAREAAAQFPGIAVEIQAVVEAAKLSGGRSADLFDEIGDLALAHAEMARAIHVESAPAKVAAWFFLLVPAGFVVLRLGSGGLSGLLSVPGQRIVVATGLVVFLVGLGAVWLLIWKAH